MVIIRFPDQDTELNALGWLAGRFSCKTWVNGETMVPETALGSLATNGFRFSGNASLLIKTMRRYEMLLPLRFNEGSVTPRTVLARSLDNCASH